MFILIPSTSTSSPAFKNWGNLFGNKNLFAFWVILVNCLSRSLLWKIITVSWSASYIFPPDIPSKHFLAWYRQWQSAFLPGDHQPGLWSDLVIFPGWTIHLCLEGCMELYSRLDPGVPMKLRRDEDRMPDCPKVTV